MRGPDLTYPSPWPKYWVLMAFFAATAAGFHLFWVSFAAWSLRLPGHWLAHSLSAPYLRLLPVLGDCLSPAPSMVLGATEADRRRHQARRKNCAAWSRAFSWYVQRHGQHFIAWTMAAGTLLAGWAWTESRKRLRVQRSDAPATSRWSTEQELRPYFQADYTSGRGGPLPLGYTTGEHGVRKGRPVWLPARERFQHVWVLGVTGAGKTSSCFKPWLVWDAHLDGVERPAMSSVVVDVKHPDIAAAVFPSASRRRRLCRLWAPFSPPGETETFNFLDYVPDPLDPLSTASVVLTNSPGHERKDPFWAGAERQLLSTLIGMVCELPAGLFAPVAERARDLLRLRDTDPLPSTRSLPFVLVLASLSPEQLVRLVETWPARARDRWRSRLDTVLSAEERILAGSMLGIQHALSVFMERNTALASGRSGIRLEHICQHPTTLVVGLPSQPREDRRVLTSLFLRVLLDVLGSVGRSSPGGLPVPVALYLDELGTLGQVGNLPEYIATYRDIGVSFTLSTQDSEQLVELFGREMAEVIIANLHTRVVFGYDLRPDQALRISRDLGEKTVVQPANQYTGGALAQLRSGARLQAATRPLVTPDELRDMPPFCALLMLPGNRRVMVRMPPLDEIVKENPRIPPPLDRAPLLDEITAHNLRTGMVLPEDLAPPEPQQEAPQAPAGETDTAGEETPPEPGQVHPGGGMEEDVPASSRAEEQVTGPGAGAVTEQPQAQNPEERQAGDGIDLSEGHLAAFFRALLGGKLADPRVPSGEPGFVHTRKTGRAMVPFGYLMDFGRKTGLNALELNSRWVAEGMLETRVSVVRGGQAVSCLVFTPAAARALPPDVQAEVAKRFVKVGDDAIRHHGQSRDGTSRQAAAAGGRTPPAGGHSQQRVEDGGGQPEGAPPRRLSEYPLLVEFLEWLAANRHRLAGHPAGGRQGADTIGYWRWRGKGGEQLLLVLRAEVLGFLDRHGARPETVAAMWRASGVFTLSQGGRLRYRARADGGKLLDCVALRWGVLRELGFPEAFLRGTSA